MFENLNSLSGNCSCGERHDLAIKNIILRSGAITELCNMIKGLNLNGSALLVCDDNTYGAAGSIVEKELKKGNIEFKTLNLSSRGRGSSAFENGEGGIDSPALVADEKAVAFVGDNLDDAGYIISVGSGTVTDICRYVSFKSAIPFISVPTAPSMDGYLSTVAAMTFGGCKVTKPAVSPIAVLADTDILSGAPKNLVLAGVGDILGKFLSLADWEISSLVTNEIFCEKIAGLTREAADRVVSSLEDIKNGNKSGIENLMYALLISGLAMQLAGNSRPASGAEHHLSHFWEMYFLKSIPHLTNEEKMQRDKVYPLHGEKVGVATVLIARIYEKVRLIEDVSKLLKPFKEITIEGLKFGYGDRAKDIYEENTPDALKNVNNELIIKNWQKIRDILFKIPSADEIEKMLEFCKAKYKPSELGIGNELVKHGLIYCIYVRNRLTLLRLLRLFSL